MGDSSLESQVELTEMYVTRRHLQKEAAAAAAAAAERQTLDENFKSHTKFRLHRTREFYVRETKYKDNRILGIRTQGKKYEQEYYSLTASDDDFTKAALTPGPSETTQTPEPIEAQSAADPTASLESGPETLSGEKQLTLLKEKAPDNLQPVDGANRTAIQALLDDKRVVQRVKHYQKMGSLFEKEKKGWFAQKSHEEELIEKSFEELPQLETANYRLEVQHVPGYLPLVQSTTRKIERCMANKAGINRPRWLHATSMRAGQWTWNMMRYQANVLLGRERSPRLSDQILYYHNMLIRTNPETIYASLRCSPQITDQEATYGAYYAKLDRNNRWTAYSSVTVLIGLVAFGWFLAIYVPTDEEEAKLQEYFRNLSTNGLLNSIPYVAPWRRARAEAQHEEAVKEISEREKGGKQNG